MAQKSVPFDKDKPLKGEGIYSFLTRHNRLPFEYMEAFIDLNKDKLDKNNNLLADFEYVLPPLTNEKTVPLFGADHEKVTIESNALNGAVIYLVNGHGGPDPGAIGIYGDHHLHEDEYAYDISLRLAKSLMEQEPKYILSFRTLRWYSK